MSETPRLYTSPGGRPLSISRRGRHGRRIGRALFVVVAVFFAWALWISRDTHPVAEFVSAERGIEAVLPHAAVARFRMASSRVWDGVPQALVGSAPSAISDGRGLPDWVIGNLIGGAAVVVANDVATWSDAVFIARMTRTGCVIERFLRLRPANEKEWAGGLNLHYWGPGRLHYAVRGRTLLASPSRDALVAALTLTPDRRVAEAVLTSALEDTGAEDARGTWTLSTESKAGRVLREIQFAVRVDENEATVKLRAEFRPEVAEALVPYWANTEPRRLAPAIEGPLMISADLGGTIEQTWQALGEVLDVTWLTADQWQAWRREDDGRSAASLLTGLLGPMGPGMSVTWQEIDLDEMSPVPVVVGAISGGREDMMDVIETLPSPGDARMSDASVVYDRETGLIEAPLMSGPAMTPVGEWHGETFYFVTDATAAAEFLGSERAKTRIIEKPANIYVRINPAECVRLLVRAGRELAQNGMLRGRTPESFEESAALWTERAATLEFVEGSAIVNSTHVEASLRVRCLSRE